MAPTFQISDQVRDVLARAEISSNSVKLTEQLDRETYLAVNKVLAAGGGKWNRKAGVHLFDRDPREALGLAIETGKATNVKQVLQAFYTPEPLALHVAQLAQVEADHRVLEPSAGMGALCEAVKAEAPKALVWAIDVDPVAVEHLKTLRSVFVVTQTDFLTVPPHPDADRVVMNPPFTNGQDMEHVTHAVKFLKPGGRLVALTSPSWQSTQSKAAQKFRELVEKYHGIIEEIAAGAFKQSGTNIRTLALVLQG